MTSNVLAGHGLDVLTCEITIGSYSATSTTLMTAKYNFTECVNVTIKDSYQTLSNTASVTFTRDVLLSLDENDDNGYRKNRILTDDALKSIFQQGDRIQIKLGYNDSNKLMFDGFINSIEAKSPFTLQCEDFGYKLKNKIVYPADVITTKNGTNINDFMGKLLEGTDIALHPQTESMEIKLGIVNLEEPRSLSELLEFWKKNFGLLSFIKMRSGKPYLAISRTYFSENKDETLVSGVADTIDTILFNENVVRDNLTFKYIDYNTLAVKATSIDKDNKRIQATIILNPEYFGSDAAINAGGFDSAIAETEAAILQAKTDNDPDAEDLYTKKLNSINKKVLNATNGEEFLVKNKSTASKKQNKLNQVSIENSFSLANYNLRTYYEYSVDMETLLKNAKSMFKTISQTGIDGSLTVFGDFGLMSASMIRLSDMRNPEKNGSYVISEVLTTFGVGGYRQTLKIPYKRSN